MKVISSRDNSIIKETASLKEKKYRDALGLYLVEGPNLVKELMEFGGRPRFIFLKAGADAEAQQIAADAPEPAAVYELTGDVFAKITDTNTPQGIAAVAEKKHWSEEEFFRQAGDGNVLVLDRLQDPGNEGTLIRLAEAMDFKGIIFIKGSADPYQPKVVRAAAGAILRTPMLFVSGPEELLEILARRGKTPFAAAMDAPHAIHETDLRKNAAIIIGNEGSGISRELMERSEKISIPMSGKTESLNAAIAGAIIMYESQRQKI